MDKIFEIFCSIDLFVIMVVGTIGSLSITLDSAVYEIDDVLKNFNQFLRCVFMYQFAIKEYLDYYVKNSGIILLIVLSSIFVLPLNLLIFFVLCGSLVIKFIVIIFIKVFGKKEGKK